MEHIEGEDMDVHILEGEEILDFVDKLFGNKEADSEFKVGDRVRSTDDINKYGHITDMCGCPFASALGFRCIDVALHDSCGGGIFQTKENHVEHID